MIRVRKADDRGHADHGWLDTWHTFSFGRYIDRRHMGFRSLRVINEDFVAPARGFPTHPHENMEILTYVLEGALRHEDSLGNGSLVVPGEVQRMTAGTGVTHSELNASEDDLLHLLQIWLLPEERGLAPGYEQKQFPEDVRRSKLALLASREGRDGSLTVHQDVDLYGSLLDAGNRVRHDAGHGRHAWIQLARGRIELNRVALEAGDGAAVSDESTIDIVAGESSELLLFDLA
ncbi:MAG: pirin family protein [Acidobacteriota bacterium]|nr:pirin family protein [Acidobacteriota bacterium]